MCSSKTCVPIREVSSFQRVLDMCTQFSRNSNSKSAPRGAILRQTGNYSRAVDELLIAVDKSEEDTSGSSVHTASCRQLVLTYNDFAVHCFK